MWNLGSARGPLPRKKGPLFDENALQERFRVEIANNQVWELPGLGTPKELQKRQNFVKQPQIWADGTKVTERNQNADFCRKPQIFADSPFLLEIPAFGGCRKPQIFVGNRRFLQETAGNCRKPQIGLRHFRSVTFSLALSKKSGLRLIRLTF